MTASNDCPRLVATVGLHGSASTWVFNVVRELMVAVVGPEAVLTLYADDVSELPQAADRAGRYLLVKSHTGSPLLDEWFAAEQARIVLSIRDPRDACISPIQRFGLPLDSAVHDVAYDCAHMIRLAAAGHAVLRYENRFYDDPGTVPELAGWFGLQVATTTMTAIFNRYRSAAVQSFVQNLSDLPAERLGTVRTVLTDKVTHFLSEHIGDGRSKKWHDLPVAAQHELTRMFSPFLDQFGYPQ